MTTSMTSTPAPIQGALVCAVSAKRLGLLSARTLLSAAVLQLIASAACAGGVVYRAQFLGNPTGSGNNAESSALAINNAGQVAGWYRMSGPAGRQGFLYSDGLMKDLGVSVAGATGWATALSDPQGISGRYFIAGDGRSDNGALNPLGFVQARNSLNLLSVTTTPIAAPALGTIEVRGVNASGRVVGTTISSTFLRTAFSRDASGQLQALAPVGMNSKANAINNAGQVAGSAQLIPSQVNAVIFESGNVRDLGTLGGNLAEAQAINARGWAAGYSRTAGSSFLHAFDYRNGVMVRIAQNLEVGAGSEANGINLSGQVVGTVYGNFATSTTNRGFIYSSSGGAVDLNPFVVNLVPNGTFIRQAHGINDLGQIAADVGAGLGVILTPEGTLTWAQSFNGRTSDSGNWDSGLGFTPNRLLDVVVSSSNGQFVQADIGFAAKSLRVGGDTAGINGRINLVLNPGATVDAGSGLLIASSGTLRGAGQVVGTVVNRGTVLAEGVLVLGRGVGGVVGEGLDNRGLVTGSGRIETNLINRGGGAAGVQVGAGQALTIAGSQHSAADGSFMRVADGGSLRFEGQLVHQAGARLHVDNGTLRVEQGMVNGGTVVVGPGNASIVGAIENNARGVISAVNGGKATLLGTLGNDGIASTSGGAQIVYLGQVSGKGRFDGAGEGGFHRFEGGYAPGAAAGASTAAVLLGDTQLASLLTLGLGGLGAGTQHDQLNFSGSVLFDTASALRVNFLGGFAPQAGARFELFVYSLAPSGSFADIILPTLGASLYWDSSQLYTTGWLAVTNQPVPEPASWALMALGGALIAFRRRSVSR